MRSRQLRLRLLLVAFLAIGGPSAQADDLEQFLRTAVGAPVEARVAWPPVARLSPGDRVGPDGQVIEMGAAEAKVEKQAATADRHPITPDKLDIGAFWPWRFLAEDLRHLSLALTLKDVVRETVQGGDQSAAPEQGFRVGTVWRARFSITVSKGPDLTEERWQALRAAALNDESETVKPGVSTIRLEPAQQVPLVWLPADDRRASPASTKERLVAPKRWALLTVASGVYSFLPPAMNQDWNAENARLVRDALSEWSPAVVRSLDARPGDGLTRDRVLAFLADGARQAKKAKASLLVVYYVGHQARSGTGGLTIFMSDAPAEPVSRLPAPATSVGNLRELMQVIDQAKAELVPDAGTLDVGVVHRRLSESGIPFVLLVDGCLDDRAFAAGRDRLGIVVDPHGGEPFYIGPGDGGTALRAIVRKLENYAADFPWLRSRNATVLGATPGTLAFSKASPKWLLGAPVAPIAQKLIGIVARTRGAADRPSLIRTLSYAADRNTIGPQELSGTVSWSDWLPHLKRFDPDSFR
ncbi:hypothetical protein [Methylobacterium oryzihabitans]|uniref:Caspase domain-containing protein n=1 Tax=Methylobacterium oryzihabitans TaxID=2499852 RepID=A0A3S3U8Z8_9HYPH|nr:hypothetical protein [Methylobacterium oryzihabitans]RVU18354.1 hypothetical protein EOE48_10670 [Methylobacterium oryzihabitans]